MVHEADDRPRRAAERDGGVRPEAALQVRWLCSVVVGVDGRARPGEVLMVIASKLKLPVTEIGVFAGLSSPSRAVVPVRIVVLRDPRRNPAAPGPAGAAGRR
jgi:hypothetical protein